MPRVQYKLRAIPNQRDRALQCAILDVHWQEWFIRRAGAKAFEDLFTEQRHWVTITYDVINDPFSDKNEEIRHMTDPSDWWMPPAPAKTREDVIHQLKQIHCNYGEPIRYARLCQFDRRRWHGAIIGRRPGALANNGRGGSRSWGLYLPDDIFTATTPDPRAPSKVHGRDATDPTMLHDALIAGASRGAEAVDLALARKALAQARYDAITAVDDGRCKAHTIGFDGTLWFNGPLGYAGIPFFIESISGVWTDAAQRSSKRDIEDLIDCYGFFEGAMDALVDACNTGRLPV
jgi:hypothetical protein